MIETQQSKIIENLFSLVYRVLWRFTPFIFSLLTVTSRDGYAINYRPFVACDRAIVAANFERNLLAVFRPKPGETVVDVGANIGLYTLIASKNVEASGRVIAIEPDESNLAILQKNIITNKCQNVTVIPIAVGASNGEMRFYEGIMPTASSFYPEKERLLHKVRGEKWVKVLRLDDVLQRLGIKEVDWIKIDAEKADLDILIGSENTLRNSRNIKLIVEDRSANTIEYLNSFGLEVNTSTGFAVRPKSA